MKHSLIRVGMALAFALSPLALAQDPVPQAPPPKPPATQEHIAAIKQSLADSQKKLQRYEWIETTVITLKGEEKSSVQNRCYHGADGVLQKVEVGEHEEDGHKPRGLRGRIAEHKKAELTESMKKAVALMHRYVPPPPDGFQSCKDAGEVSVALLDPGKRLSLEFRDFVLKGDLFALEVDLTTNRLLSATVSSYLDTPDDPVELKIRFAGLIDGSDATYPAEVVVNLKSEQLVVDQKNTGYRLMDQ